MYIPIFQHYMLNISTRCLFLSTQSSMYDVIDDARLPSRRYVFRICQIFVTAKSLQVNLRLTNS